MDDEDERGEVRLLDDGGEQGRDDVFDEGVDDGGKCGADDDCDSEIDNVAAKDKVAKAFQHWKLLSES